MLIMSIGKLVNLLENRKVEQKTNKLLILSVELILLYFSTQRKKLVKEVFINFYQEKSKQRGKLYFSSKQNRWTKWRILTRSVRVDVGTQSPLPLLCNLLTVVVAWAPGFSSFIFSVLVKLTGLNPALPYNFLYPTFLYYRRETTVMAIRIFIRNVWRQSFRNPSIQLTRMKSSLDLTQSS